MGVLYVEHANVLELCYIELLSGDGSPYSILSGNSFSPAQVISVPRVINLILLIKLIRTNWPYTVFKPGNCI